MTCLNTIIPGLLAAITGSPNNAGFAAFNIHIK